MVWRFDSFFAFSHTNLVYLLMNSYGELAHTLRQYHQTRKISVRMQQRADSESCTAAAMASKPEIRAVTDREEEAFISRLWFFAFIPLFVVMIKNLITLILQLVYPPRLDAVRMELPVGYRFVFSIVNVFQFGACSAAVMTYTLIVRALHFHLDRMIEFVISSAPPPVLGVSVVPVPAPTTPAAAAAAGGMSSAPSSPAGTVSASTEMNVFAGGSSAAPAPPHPASTSAAISSLLRKQLRLAKTVRFWCRKWRLWVLCFLIALFLYALLYAIGAFQIINGVRPPSTVVHRHRPPSTVTVHRHRPPSTDTSSLSPALYTAYRLLIARLIFCRRLGLVVWRRVI